MQYTDLFIIFVFFIIPLRLSEVTECIEEPCMNNATCVDLIGGYSCICGPGWNGTNCEENIQECRSDPCQNGATCIDELGSYQCLCAPGWTGSTCEFGMFQTVQGFFPPI